MYKINPLLPAINKEVLSKVSTELYCTWQARKHQYSRALLALITAVAGTVSALALDLFIANDNLGPIFSSYEVNWFTLVMFVPLVIWVVTHARVAKAENDFNSLSDAPDSAYMEIALWLEDPTFKTYMDGVKSHKRRLMQCEYFAFKRFFADSDNKVAKIMQQRQQAAALQRVYGEAL